MDRSGTTCTGCSTDNLIGVPWLMIGLEITAATRAPGDRNADHIPRSIGGHSLIKLQQVTASKGALAFAT
jgi:hypothetical protein